MMCAIVFLAILGDIRPINGVISMVRPFIKVPNAASFELIYTWQNYILENKLHVYAGQPFDLAMLQTLRDRVNNWDNVAWANCRNTQVTLSRIRTKGLSYAEDVMEDYTLNPPRGGNLNGTLCPLNVSFAVKMGSGNTGRSTRGRLFVPGINVGDVTGNNILAARATSYVEAIEHLIQALKEETPLMYLCIVSYMHDKVWRGEGVKYAVGDVSFTDLRLDSQRRRLGSIIP